MSENDKSMIDVLMSIGIDTLDDTKLKTDEAELRRIADEFPEDGLVDIAQYERMAGLCMRGISICDYWVPILMVLVGEVEAKRDRAKAKAYTEAEEPRAGRLTADVRKMMSEGDDEYNRLRMLAERLNAIKTLFDRKSHSFTKFHVFMKDQQKNYLYKGGREISGESLEFHKGNNNTSPPKKSTNGQEDW